MSEERSFRLVYAARGPTLHHTEHGFMQLLSRLTRKITLVIARNAHV